MSIFEAVKRSVTTRQAAKHFGIRAGRNGMCRCPFHADRNPSMKVDRRYYCFGCGATGDVIDFVSRLEGISPKEAALLLARAFSVPHEDKGPPGRSRPLPRQLHQAQGQGKAQPHQTHREKAPAQRLGQTDMSSQAEGPAGHASIPLLAGQRPGPRSYFAPPGSFSLPGAPGGDFLRSALDRGQPYAYYYITRLTQ